MITKLTEAEVLNVQLSSFWFVPAKRAAAMRKLRKLEASPSKPKA